MGKSPAKWIKSVLFGKKASKSNYVKSKEKPGNKREVHVRVEAPEPLSALSPPPVVSSGLSNTAAPVEGSLGSECREPLTGQQDGEMTVPGNQTAAAEHPIELDPQKDPQKIRKENAATKAQAAFRGYLARRAFKALKGIIRLQALIRGHLVRRQAVSTLYSMIGIVKLQAIVRGSRIRCSNTGLEVQNVCAIVNSQDDKLRGPDGVDVSRKIAISSGNAFVRKLLAPSPIVVPLLVQYDSEDSNSVVSWLERWSLSCPWKPAPPSKKVRNQKKKHGNTQPVETDSGRPKRSVCKVHSNNDSNPLQVGDDIEKPRRNLKKVLINPVDSVQENPQSELEKIKRNLRKVHGTVTESSVQPEVVTEKPKQNPGKLLNIVGHDVAEKPTQNHIIAQDVSVSNEISKADKVKEETNITVSDRASVLSEPAEVESNVDSFKLNETVELSIADQTVITAHSPESNGKDENVPPSNEESKSKNDSPLSEHQKSARRASLPAKQDHVEDGIQNTPKLPSYMAATESAKAKLRGQGSPRFSQDGAEKNNVTRRHSLPSSTNGKLNSGSPRTLKPVQVGVKGGNKNDRSILSSRDGNGKPVQVEWRR
ncbi:IQ-domain [Dionaea muscipula]